jgi:hypothetical protein
LVQRPGANRPAAFFAASGRTENRWWFPASFAKPRGTTGPSGNQVTQRLCLIVVKPSHYDGDGYVISGFVRRIGKADPSADHHCL